ncbi:MAG TPA: hypothetical protein VM143_04860 [Acidimicrobiales bacterium]|nr:hypothetical protein [Acidimicrobiales bacterium]
MDTEEALRAMARKQYAMVARRQAAENGVSWEAQRSRLRTGTWTLATPRVLRLAGAPPHPLDPHMAAVLDGGPGTVLNRRSGALVWGVAGFPPAIPQVSRRRGSSTRPPHNGELRLLRYLPDELTTVVSGIPTVTLPFLLFQLAGSERADRVERALDTVCTRSPAVHLRLHQLLPELAEHGRNGIVLMREWLDRNPPGSRPVASGLEGRFRRILEQAGEPPLDRQVDVGGHEWIGRVDFADRSLSALFEVDSLLHHSSELDMAHDADRDARLLAAGWASVDRILEEWVWYEPDRAVAVVREARRRLRRSGSRIPPSEAGSA